MKKLSILLLVLCLSTSAFAATAITLKISGDGALNDSTIAVGKKVSVDVYVQNEGNFKGMSLGFKIESDNIKKVLHPSDSANGVNKNGDVKAYNGWQDKTVWDLGFFVAPTDWDGALPDLLGIGGVSMFKGYKPHETQKMLSFDLIFEEAGTITIDSSFFEPSGRWMFAEPKTAALWDGPYTFTVKK